MPYWPSMCAHTLMISCVSPRMASTILAMDAPGA